MNKRGQFFLIAAVVIVGIIITLATVNISTKKPVSESAAFYDLSSEIKYEANKLIDYGVYNAQTQQVGLSITSLVNNYSNANPDTALIFIYGDENNLKQRNYDPTSTGKICTISTVCQPEEQSIGSNKDITREIRNGVVEVELAGEKVLSFELKEGQNFFIVLKKDVEGETLVAQQ